MKVVDDSANSSPISNGATGVTAPSGGGTSVNHLVISQIRVSGSTDDVVEIYNPTGRRDRAGEHVRPVSGGQRELRVPREPVIRWERAGARLVSGRGERLRRLAVSRRLSWEPRTCRARPGTRFSSARRRTSPAAPMPRSSTRSATARRRRVPREGGKRRGDAGLGTVGHRESPGTPQGNGQDTDVNSADFSPPGTAVWRNHASTPAIPLDRARKRQKLSLPLQRSIGGAASRLGERGRRDGVPRLPRCDTGFHGRKPRRVGDAGGERRRPTQRPLLLCLFYVVKATDGAGVSAE